MTRDFNYAELKLYKVYLFWTLGPKLALPVAMIGRGGGGALMEKFGITRLGKDVCNILHKMTDENVKLD